MRALSIFEDAAGKELKVQCVQNGLNCDLNLFYVDENLIQ